LDLHRFGIDQLPALAPRFNISPGEAVLVVRLREGARHAEFIQWGLVPSWASDPSIGARLANARSDSAFEKPSFRDAIRLRRCLIPADLFYEWQAIPGQRKKQPYAVRLRSEEPFALGGIWEFWRPKAGGEGFASCAILTTAPNTLMSPIHDRMPVIVPPERFRAWLDPRTPSPAIVDIMQSSYPSDDMEAWPIGLRVNNPKDEDPEVLVREEITS
jgi:putative SOS response-associated peptidase YedK